MYTGNAADFEAAALLLLDIAGPAPQHIEMSSRGPKKYYTVPRALSLDDAREHLSGRKTRGALCSRPDGTTRALAYDADEPERWQLLQEAARKLAGAGYTPLLEPSPRGDRGGHLWLIYTALVDARDARSHAHAIAPELAQIAEYWPGPIGAAWNRVRLPGGRYVAPGLSAWCHLYDATGQERARHGLSAARVLLEMQTSTELVPALSPDSHGDRLSTVTRPTGATERDTRGTVTPEAPAATGDHQPPVTTDAPGPEQRSKRHSPLLRNEPQQQAQPRRFLWFQYSVAQLAEWFNRRHSLEELHPRERGSGMAFSPSVNERTPSTGYYDTERGERWTDFSAHARRTNGGLDGGDVLELYVRLQGQSKTTVLSSLGREMIAEARVALEAAASSGAEPPVWVCEIMTPAGWQRYRMLAQARHDQNQGNDQCWEV